MTSSLCRGNLLDPGIGGCLLHPLGLNVLHSSLDGILRQHAAVELHRRQTEVLGNVSVLDGQDVIDGPALHPARSQKQILSTA